MIIGSGIGGILYFMIGIKIYIIAIILVCLSIFDIGFSSKKIEITIKKNKYRYF